MSIRMLVLASAGALVGTAQIQEMSANADGSSVVFVEASTSALYRIDFETPPRRAVATRIAPPPAFARYSRPQFLADGSIAYTNISCFRLCTSSQTYRSKDGAAEFVGNGTGFASANGRYLYLRNLDYFLSQGTVFGSRLIDTQTNRTLCEALPGSPEPECMGRGFLSGPTNLGQALLMRASHPLFGGGYEVFRRDADGSQTPAIREPEPPTAAVISANGEAAAYLAHSRSGFDLVNASLDRGLRQPSGLPPAANFIAPPVLIASDGSFTLFARSVLPTTAPPAITTALYLFRRSTATEQRLATEPGQFTSLALTGDDRYAIYATSEGAIRRIALATGAVEDWGRQHLINRAGTDNAASAGSLAQILASGFSNAAVTVNGLPALILAQDANRILYFVPPETVLGNLTVEVTQSGAPIPITTFLSVPVEPVGKGFFDLPAGDRLWVAAHEDFSGPVTPLRPARSGELVHLYARDLGTVTPAVPFAQPAPASPPSRLVNPLQCEVSVPFTAAAPVAFAGLAPGFAGVYQIDVRLPAVAAAGNVYLACGPAAALGANLPMVP